ncbi:hypothetical protein [Microbulbifer sp. ZKSA002]|uniref:hypothetical protein n=1 Tax=Microbulbifer sp. ZKSA002 TaxID=3243388 RepID=UPI004039DB32
MSALYGFFVGKGIHVDKAQLLSDPHLVHLVGTLCMMAQPWAACLLSGYILYRSDSYNMYELTAAVEVSQARQQVVKLAALCLILVLLGMVGAFGLLAGLASRLSSLPDTFDLLSAALKLQGLQLLVGLPAALLFVSVFWLQRNLSRSPILIYLGGFLWFIGYIFLASASGSPLMTGSMVPASWFIKVMEYLDWFGLTVLMGSKPSFILLGVNRILVIVVAIAVALIAFRLEGIGYPHYTRSILKFPKQNNEVGLGFIFTEARPQALFQFFTLVRLQCIQIFMHPVMWLVGIIWCFVIIGETYPSLHYVEPGAELLGLSPDAINRFMWSLIPLFGSIMLLYMSDSLVRQDQRQGIEVITNTLPVFPSAVMLAWVVSLLVVLIMFLLLSAFASVLSQWLKVSPIDFIEYGRFIFYSFMPLAALGCVFLAIQFSVNSRPLALLLCSLLLILRFSPLAELLGLHHPLFLPFNTPLTPTNEYWGYQTSLDGFWAFMTFWCLLTISLLLGAIFLAKYRCIPFLTLSSALILVGFTISTFLLVYQGVRIQTGIDVNGRLLDPDTQVALLAEYERGYSFFAELPMPKVTNVNTQVDFFPKQRRMKISGEYQLVNPHSQPIQTLLIGEYWNAPVSYIGLSKKAALEYNRQLGQRVYLLETPLLPGGVLTLDFELELAQNGYTSLSTHKILTENFSYLRSVPFFPVIGYQSIRELKSEDLRYKFGLPMKPSLSVEEALAARDRNKDGYSWALMETLISTPLGYQSFTQGELVERWQQDNRHFRRFVTQQPVRNLQGFIAAPLKLSNRYAGDVKLQVAYRPLHEANVEMTLEAMVQTVDFLSTHISPYNGHTLTLVEKPNIGSTGYALPQMMLIGSRVGFRALQNKNMPFSQAFRRTVHETAHQWFGHWLGNGVEQDSAFLVESLAKYVELLILERCYGEAVMQRLIDFERERYLAVENYNHQEVVSLVSAQSPHDRYSRATLAFARLRQDIGDAPILAALRELGEMHGYPSSPATSLDFVNALVRQAPTKQVLIETLFTRPVPATEWLNELAIEKS